MLHAYDDILLENARDSFGTLIEYVVYNTKDDVDSFLNAFSKTSISKELEEGNAIYLLGKSGVDIYVDVVHELTGVYSLIDKEIKIGLTKEFWCGYVIAYYQWFTRRKYKEIFNSIKISELIDAYDSLHESDITKTFLFIDNIVLKKEGETRLKKYRKSVGISQKELSRRSNVGLRSIQMYEEGNKDINKASLISIYKLSKSLFCNVEDLIEPNRCINLKMEDFL